MVAKFFKVLVILTCIPLLTGCEITIMASLGLSFAVSNKYLYLESLNMTYDKEFFVRSDASNNYTESVAKFREDISPINEQYPQIQFTSLIQSTFFTKILHTKRTFSEELWLTYGTDDSIDGVKLTIFKEPQEINDSIIVYTNESLGINDYYLIKDALNYQWHKGYVYFLNQYNATNDSQINNDDIQYKIDLSILTDLVDANKDKNDKSANATSFNTAKAVSFHYKYNIQVVNKKTNKVYLNKNLMYDDDTSVLTGDVAYIPYGNYVLTMIKKNREVIDKEVFTDELYKALTVKSN